MDKHLLYAIVIALGLGIISTQNPIIALGVGLVVIVFVDLI